MKTKPSSGDQRLNNLVPNENENTKKLEQSTIAIRSFIPKKTSSKSKNTFKTLIMVNPKQSIPSQVSVLFFKSIRVIALTGSTVADLQDVYFSFS